MRLRRRHKELATNKVSFAIVAISVRQSVGDGVKVRGWQSDSLEPAAFKALVEGWEQVRVTRMRSTCRNSYATNTGHRGIKTIGLYCTTTVSCGRAISTRNEPSFSIWTGSKTTSEHAIRFAITPCSSCEICVCRRYGTVNRVNVCVSIGGNDRLRSAGDRVPRDPPPT